MSSPSESSNIANEAPPQKPSRPPKPTQLIHPPHSASTTTSNSDTLESDAHDPKDASTSGSASVEETDKPEHMSTHTKPPKPPRGHQAASTSESSRDTSVNGAEHPNASASAPHEPVDGSQHGEKRNSSSDSSRSSVSIPLITLPGTPDEDGEESGTSTSEPLKGEAHAPAHSSQPSTSHVSESHKGNSGESDVSSATKRRPTMVATKDGRVLPARPNTMRKKVSRTAIPSVTEVFASSSHESASTDSASPSSSDKKDEEHVELKVTVATVDSSSSSPTLEMAHSSSDLSSTTHQEASQDHQHHHDADQHVRSESEDHQPHARQRSQTYDPELGFDAASPFDIEELSEREAPKLNRKVRVPLPPQTKSPVVPVAELARTRSQSVATPSSSSSLSSSTVEGAAPSKRVIPLPPSTTPAKVAPLVVPSIPVVVDHDADREERELEKRLKKERKEQEKRGRAAAAAAAAAASASASIRDASASAANTAGHPNNASPSLPPTSPHSLADDKLPIAGEHSSAVTATASAHPSEENPSPTTAEATAAATANSATANSASQPSSSSSDASISTASTTTSHHRSNSANDGPKDSSSSSAEVSSTTTTTHEPTASDNAPQPASTATATATSSSPPSSSGEPPGASAKIEKDKHREKEKDKEHSKSFFSKFTERFRGKKHKTDAETAPPNAQPTTSDHDSESDSADPLLGDAALTPSVTPREGSMSADGATHSASSTNSEVPYPTLNGDTSTMEIAELETHKRVLISQIKSMEELHSKLKATIAEERQKLAEARTQGRDRSKSIGAPASPNTISSPPNKKKSHQAASTASSMSTGHAPKLSTRSSSASSSSSSAINKSSPSLQQFASVAGFTLSEGREGDIAAGFGFKQKLGQSALGSVYACRQLKSGLMVCIRIVSFETPQIAGEVASQFKSLVKLDCKQLAAILAAPSTGNELWLISEYCPIGSLRTLLETGALQLGEDQIRFIAVSCLKALDFLHRNQLTHGSVELTNILMDSIADIKLCDYGLVELLKSKSHTPDPSSASSASFEAKVTADIRAFGETLAEMAEWSEKDDGEHKNGLRNTAKFTGPFNSFVSDCLANALTITELLQHPFLAAGSASAQPLVEAIANALRSLRSRATTPSQTPTRTREELDDAYESNPERATAGRIRLHSRATSNDLDISSPSGLPSEPISLSLLPNSKRNSAQRDELSETEEDLQQSELSLKTPTVPSSHHQSPSQKLEVLHQELEVAMQKVLQEGHGDTKSALESLRTAFLKAVKDVFIE